MTRRNPAHPRHAQLVEGLQEYLASARKSERWLGLTVANDPRLMPNLKRGQHYPPRVMRALYDRLVAFYEQELASLRDRKALDTPAEAPLRLAA